jgi:hypothetical protein
MPANINLARMSRPEAIRRLEEFGLTVKAKAK